MQKLQYHLVDVFTDQPFGGNQLAVFTSGQHITPEQMQRIARELNLSESSFVLPAKDANSDFWVRIFTPGMEIPMAGHPTVGTAFVLAREGFIDTPTDDGEVTVKFEEGVGIIPVTLRFENGEPTLITMQQPLPTFGEVVPDRAKIAEMLSLGEADLDANYPIQEVSCGVPFLYIPIKNLDAMRRVKLRLDVWEERLKTASAPHVFTFTPETALPGSTVHSRMFAPTMGISEDPATGAASGPLGAYLVKYGIAKGSPAQIISEQGFEMGRPSLIHITIEHSGVDQITRVLVGGQSAAVGEGAFYDDIFE